MEKQGYLSKKRNPSKNKVVLIILSIFIFVVSLFLAWKIELYLYRPLSDKDFSNLFPHYTSVRKISSQDVLIESIHGEIYELHTFLVENASVNEQYPLTESKWENLKKYHSHVQSVIAKSINDRNKKLFETKKNALQAIIDGDNEGMTAREIAMVCVDGISATAYADNPNDFEDERKCFENVYDKSLAAEANAPIKRMKPVRGGY